MEGGGLPVYRTTRAHPEFWSGAGEEVGKAVHDGGGHGEGRHVLVDLLQLVDHGAGHQPQDVVGEVQGHCGPLVGGKEREEVMTCDRHAA